MVTNIVNKKTITDNKWSISFQRKIEYEIIKCKNLFDPDNDFLAAIGERDNSKRFIILDHALYADYHDLIEKYFQRFNTVVKIISFESSELSKSMEMFKSILDELEVFCLKRRGQPIIAIGGGVLTDIAGFVASSYRRGIPHIKIPTTLLGYVDASIGIKSSINFNNIKNLIGAFEPPQKVLLDHSFLATLPKRHLLNGVGEIIKLAVIKDKSLFVLLEKHGAKCTQQKFQNAMGQEILDLSIAITVEELEPNLYEDSLLRAMDFGHTFSLAYEMGTAGKILHGEAVVHDIILSVFLANEKKLLATVDSQRILALIAKLNYKFPSDNSIDLPMLWESVVERMQHRNGYQRIPLPSAIGEHTFINDLTLKELFVAYDRKHRWEEENGLNSK